MAVASCTSIRLTAGRGRSRPVVGCRARGDGVESVNLDEAVADHEGVGSDEVVSAVAVGAEGDVDDLALHLDRGYVQRADERKNLLVACADVVVARADAVRTDGNRVRGVVGENRIQ